MAYTVTIKCTGVPQPSGAFILNEADILAYSGGYKYTHHSKYICLDNAGNLTYPSGVWVQENIDFDYAKGASFFAFAFCSILLFWWVGRAIGGVYKVLKAV